MSTQTVARSELSQGIGFIGARQDERFIGESVRIMERLAKKRMTSSDIRPVDLIEQELIIEVCPERACRRHADINLIAQKGRDDRFPSRDINYDLCVAVVIVKTRDAAVQRIADEDLNELDGYFTGDFLD